MEVEANRIGMLCGCTECVHAAVDHDEVARRWCVSTAKGRLDRECVCAPPAAGVKEPAGSADQDPATGTAETRAGRRSAPGDSGLTRTG